VGIYISEHPLARVIARLNDVLSGSVGTLGEEISGEQVTIAGMVQRIYRHTTKKGNEMAFVTLEDVQGSCDVVVFPNVWKKTRPIWRTEEIVVVHGKVDTSRRDEPSLLCSWVKRPEEVTVDAGDQRARQEQRADSPSAAPGRIHRPNRLLEPLSPPAEPVEPQHQPARSDKPGAWTVRVTLQRSSEQKTDKEKLREIHDLLVAYKGQDQFVIHLADGSGGGVELRFPNQGTTFCPELQQNLEAVVGATGVTVEPSS